MAFIGEDILRYVGNHPPVYDQVVKSFKEIVPLLDGDHLVIYWNFISTLQVECTYCIKIRIFKFSLAMVDANHHIHQFYFSLSPKQIQSFLLWQFNVLSPSLQSPFTPTQQTSVVNYVEWESMAISLISFIGNAYAQDVDMAQKFMCASKSLLTMGYVSIINNLEEVDFTSDDFVIPPLVRLVHHSSFPNESFIGILSTFKDLNLCQTALKAVLVHYALFKHMQQKGLTTLSNLENSCFINELIQPCTNLVDFFKQWITSLNDSKVKSALLEFLELWINPLCSKSVNPPIDHDQAQPSGTISFEMVSNILG